LEKKINLEKIRRELELVKCPVHNETRKVTIKGNNDISIENLCCDKFKEAINKRFKALVDQEVKKDLNNLFKPS
jgi:hypothetical protein